ncbi:MAG: class I SAM-dependent methyltransferase [Anaerolineales bacterium]|nr:class I SAM-dependent methyltransferase [Anaerolineales bacterium]
MENYANTKGIEYVNCNLCGSNNAELHFQAPVLPYRVGIYNRDVWDVVRCRNCGLIYVNPRIDDEAREAFYSFQTPGDDQFVQEWFLESADLHRPNWQRFIRTMQKHQPDGKLLDIGCGAGTFLVEARKMGYEVFGQEVAPYFIKYCREEQNLTIYGDFMENLQLAPESFDCVTNFDVIEHHPDPKLLVSQMYDLLRPGGLAVISTHDIGNFFARHYGVKWRYIRPIGHITYFTRDTLARLMTDCGFRVVQAGGSHTIDETRFKVFRNYIRQFMRVIVLRALILWVYKPLAERLPALRRWQFKIGGATLNHEKLLVRASNQIIMDDDMVILARKV